MEVSYNLNLRKHNSFGLSTIANRCYSIYSEEDFREVLTDREHFLCIGGGSNILFKNSELPVVVLNKIKLREIVEEFDDDLIVKIGAGENWHEFVLWCLGHSFGGVENLSLIPGSVGAAPIQNIGAYGVEIKDIFYGLEAIEIVNGKKQVFSKEDCTFDYRYSIFKGPLKSKYLITYVLLKLTKTNHNINTSYGAIAEVLEKWEIKDPTIQDVSKAVIQIRTSKLPDPAVIGNAGSFFKNPVIDSFSFERLRSKFPDVKFYALPTGYYKIPAAWLIEKCKWKGKRIGDAGVYPHHALVLVNYGAAQGQDIYSLAMNIQEAVKEKFDINLESEVNII